MLFPRFRPFDIILFLLALATAAGAQPDSRLSKALIDNRYAVSLDQGQLEGAGAELLLREARQSHYFMIGEEHGVADIIELTHALYRQMQPLGYHWYVTEVGPVSSARLATLTSQAAIAKPFEDFYARFPFAIPFAVYQEEVALLRTVMRQSSARPQPILGIDQEFILSVPMHLLRLEAITQNQQYKAFLRNTRMRELDNYAEIVRSGDPESVPTIMTGEREESTVERLAIMFPEAGTEEHNIAQALIDSRRIYRHFAEGEYNRNNEDRARLMDEYFNRWHEQIATEHKQPRYLFKLGSNHVARERTVLGILDIGYTVAELAEQQGSQSFHLLTLPVSGTRNAWVPFLPDAMKNTNIEIEDSRYGELARLFGELPEADGGQWQLYDLRPLHADPGTLPPADSNLGNLLKGYDAVLVLTDVEAATLVPQGDMDPDQ